MVFSSTIFLFAFLPLTIAGYYFADRRFKNAFLLLASLFFYAWGEPRFVFVMIGSVLVNHLFALLIRRRICRAEKEGCPAGKKPRESARWLLCLMVIFNLSLFFIYKYLNFTIKNINAVGALFGKSLLPQTNIALPIGISFFTFQAMSYVFDVYYGWAEVQKNPLDTLLYVSLFPQLIAGPIVRYGSVAKEITGRKETLDDFVRGVKRFIVGLGKKTILANNLALVADGVFARGDQPQCAVLMAWFGAACYMLQVYFDFSGYSDMAIGLGSMFGFHFQENFCYPYISRTISEFWRRWHISLGSWFRDYLFMPISTSRWMRKLSAGAKKRWGGRSREIVKTVVPLAAVWSCTGLWHGANWTYILWGCWFGAILILDLFLSPAVKRLKKALHIPEKAWWFQGLQILRTLFLVLLADVVFRSESLGEAFRYMGYMFGLAGNRAVDTAAVLLVERNAGLFLLAAVLAAPVFPWLRRRVCEKSERLGAVYEHVSWLGHFAMFIIAIAMTVTSTYNPFIYFNF